jgi:hypothetical protein
MLHRFSIIAIALAILAGCAAPAVDRSSPAFNATKYTDDLNTCRGGSAVSFALETVQVAVIGAAFGALEGASTGAISGDADEGALIGAIVGGVVGVGIGMHESLSDQSNGVKDCLGLKGYRLAPA